MYYIISHSFLAGLAGEGIRFLRPAELTEESAELHQGLLQHCIFPARHPNGGGRRRLPFPMLMNKSLNLAVLLESEREEDGKVLFAAVQAPSVLPRFIELPEQVGKRSFILLEDVICQNIGTLFRGNRLLEVAPFRITRNADMHFDEEHAEDLLEEIEKELKKQRMGEAVRLEVAQSMSAVLRETLRTSLELLEDDVYSVNRPLDPSFFMKFYSLPGYDHLRFEEITPQSPRDLIGENGIFEAIAHKDILLLHPFESFDPVLHFVMQAAEDPSVLAIKQTLYRVSGNSPIVSALARAAENGKQVTA